MPPKKKTAKAYQMAVDVPEGTAVGNFVVGKQFAKGGFGKIYEGTSAKNPSEKVVIKIEPSENGPLFTEISVFVRCLKPTLLDAWKKANNVKFLGLPHFLGSGLFQHNGSEMRFLAMPKYACSMENVRAKNPEMKVVDVLAVTQCMLTSLQYLHSQDIVHADVKADNILLTDSKRFDRSVLVDFGLARRIPAPREKADPKKAHNGTAIFTSLDAHRGCAPSYRGDIEILAYNVIYWLTGSLPWQAYETQLETVANAKRRLLSGRLKSLETDFEMNSPMRRFVADLLETVDSCSYESRPDFVALFKRLEKATAESKSTISTAVPGRRRTRKSLVAPVASTSSPARKLKAVVTPKSPSVETSSRRSKATRPANNIIPGLRNNRKYQPRSDEPKVVEEPAVEAELPEKTNNTDSETPPDDSQIAVAAKLAKASQAYVTRNFKRAAPKAVEEDLEDLESPSKKSKPSPDLKSAEVSPEIQNASFLDSPIDSPVIASSSRRTKRILDSSAEEYDHRTSSPISSRKKAIFDASLTSIEPVSSRLRTSRRLGSASSAKTTVSDAGSFLNSSSCVPETPESEIAELLNADSSALLDSTASTNKSASSPQIVGIGVSPMTKNTLASRIPGVHNMRNIRRSVYKRVVNKYRRPSSSSRRAL